MGSMGWGCITLDSILTGSLCLWGIYMPKLRLSNAAYITQFGPISLEIWRVQGGWWGVYGVISCWAELIMDLCGFEAFGNPRYVF
jgi:hypothetical protein